jgi:hypothetical protein
VVAVADRALNVAGGSLAVLMPLALGLALALVQPSALLAVLVLWGFWLVGLAVIALVVLRPALGPQISHHTTQTIRGH